MKFAKVKFNGGRGALLCNNCGIIIKEGFNIEAIVDKLYYCSGDYCKLQDNCKYGYVFPDRCRYVANQSCPCGAYPPKTFLGKVESYPGTSFNK